MEQKPKAGSSLNSPRTQKNGTGAGTSPWKERITVLLCIDIIICFFQRICQQLFLQTDNLK